MAVASPLPIALDIVVSPQKALEAVRARPAAGLVFLLLSSLVIFGTLLQGPATHWADLSVMDHQISATHDYDAYSAQEIQGMRRDTLNPPAWHQWVIGGVQLALVTIGLAVMAGAMTILSMLWGSGTDFRTMWAAVVYAATPTVGLFYVVAGLICLLVGAEQFTSYDKLVDTIPNLGMLIPTDSNLKSALEMYAPATIWNFCLDALILRTIGGLGRAYSIIAIVVFAAALGAVGAMIP